MSQMAHKDRLFEGKGAISDFQFDADVARVFDDMIKRSVPCYDLVQSLMIDFAARFYRPGTVVYDLGCSLAETSLRLASALPPDCRIIGVDNSPDMVTAARLRVEGQGHANRIEIREGSIADSLPEDAATVVVISLALQFVRPLEREAIIRQVYRALRAGGILLVFEKIILPDASLNRLFIDSYYEFKAKNGYSEEEISRKRIALENVLIPFTLSENAAILTGAGFQHVHPFFQWLNFAGFIAIK